MYKIIFLFLCLTLFNVAKGQGVIKGRVLSSRDRLALFGSTVHLSGNAAISSTDKDGYFSIITSKTNDTLTFKHIGYVEKKVLLRSKDRQLLLVLLDENITSLGEVVINTGYYQRAQESTTGSFIQIDNKLINRGISTNILSRLEGVTNSLHFDRRNITGESIDKPSLRIRGLSTIQSNEMPLIVVDNFPYENDLNSINPNDVESITILKDAAAAAIWGARAGNGVIVITTKQGKYNQQTKISFNSNLTVATKPDLYYNQNYLPSLNIMNIENELFEKGAYSETPETVLPDFVELLIKKRDGLINDGSFQKERELMARTDIRKEALRYLYQSPVNQQYALNVSGGGNNYRFYLSGGYDRNRSHVIGNEDGRLNLNIQNTFKLTKGLEIIGGIWLTEQKRKNNGLTISNLKSLYGNTQVSPYTRLSDTEGRAVAIPFRWRSAYTDVAVQDGLLDWRYRPLEEIRLANKTGKTTEMRLNTSLNYTFLKSFTAAATYQYMDNKGSSQNHYFHNSYYVRNMVNMYTQPDGTRIIPYGGIMDGAQNAKTSTQSGRIQLNYLNDFSETHQLSALAGAELRQQVLQSLPGYIIYNFNDELYTGTNTFNYTQYYTIRPLGNLPIPQASAGIGQFTDRYLSYFGNATYTYAGRYVFSGSLRWDGSNLFGVKTNQKGVPLWSAGGSWSLSKESFYTSLWLPYLRIRATYGSSGNVNKTVSVFPIVSYSTESLSQLPKASITSVGNPSLRWEKVNILNFGADFATSGSRLQGGLEFYAKNSHDLIGEDYMAPSSGIIDGASVRNLINYASMQTKGVDIQLNTQNIKGTFGWGSTFLFSYVKDKITDYSTKEAANITEYFNSTTPPKAGRSRDVLYWFPWKGLDHESGAPLVEINGIQAQIISPI